ncbi:MAG: septum formation protein Maf [Verrucomicrobia bacterium]|nr:septum formation protein Maf [Verrucomicrobiota bacterium]
MHLPTVILASRSPRRSELLRQLDFPFDVLPSDLPEIEHEQMTAGELCQINAYRKARAISKQHPDCLVMGVDTLVALEHRVFGKPANMEEARRMLEELQGKSHHVATGVCLICLRGHHQKLFCEITEVTFRSLNPHDIDHYLSKVDPLDKAGGYAIQEHGDDIVRNIHGSFSNVVGLPLERLRAELAEFDLEHAPAH